MFVTEIIKELLQVLGVVDLVDDLLDGAEDVHAVPVEVLRGLQLVHGDVGLLSEHCTAQPSTHTFNPEKALVGAL